LNSHINSYYAASANQHPERTELCEDLEAEFCVIGAGFTGLSAALHLAELGKSVVVLESAKVGWGASGRNGGQIVNGLNASLNTVEKRFGSETANFIGTVLQEGGSIIRQFVSTYNIDCDLKKNNIYVAFNAKQMRELEGKQTLWRQHGMDDHQLLDASELKQHVNSEQYCGGMLDTTGGHLHPLNLALGEASACEKLGVQIYENSRVLDVSNMEGSPTVKTQNGTVQCKTLIICGNAYLGNTVKPLAKRVMPVSTQVMATEPLDHDLAHSLLPGDACIEDVRYILDYYRLSADKRLLFGGGTVYGGTDPANVEAKLRPNMEKVFPQLKNVKVDYAWSGNFALSFSRVPQMGQLGPNCYHAMGYSGHGVTGSHLFGRVLSEAVTGDTRRFDQFAKIPWLPFPGGQRFRAPYSTVGSWWYGLRDKLGV